MNNLSEQDLLFRDQIAKRDEFKILNKKLQILKQALRQQRQLAHSQIQTIAHKTRHMQQIRHQILKKEAKNQILNSEINQLKEDILLERNKKRKLREELEVLTTGTHNPQQQT